MQQLKSATPENRLHGKLGRIKKMLDNNANPDPIPHQCLIDKDGQKFRSVTLKHGEFASIRLAGIRVDRYRSTPWWMTVHHADGQISVGYDLLLEVTLTAKFAKPLRWLLYLVQKGYLPGEGGTRQSAREPAASS